MKRVTKGLCFYKGQCLFEVGLIRFESSGFRIPRQKIKGKTKGIFHLQQLLSLFLRDMDFFPLSPINTHTNAHLLQNYLVTWLHLKYQGKSNSHLYLFFSASCSAGHSRIEYKVPDISAEKEKHGKLHSVTSTQGPGEGMQFIEFSTRPNLIPAFLSHLLSAHAKLPCMGKRMPQSRGPTFGKQVLLCL